MPLEVGYSYTTLVNGFSALDLWPASFWEIRELEGVKFAFIAPALSCTRYGHQ